MPGNYEMVFKGEEADLVNSFLKINRQFDQVKTRATESTRRTRESQGAFRQMGNEVAGSLSSMVAGFVSIQTGIQEVQRMWQDWNRQIEETGESINNFTNRLVGLTSGRGDPISEVGPRILEIGERFGMSQQQILETYDAAGGAMPLASTEQILRTFEAGAPFAALGLDPRIAVRAMGLQQRFAPRGADIDPMEQQNLILAQMQLAGENVEQLTSQRAIRAQFQMQRLGFEPREITEIMLAASQAGERPATITTQIAGVAEMGVQAPRPLSREQQMDPRARQRFDVLTRYSQMSREDIARNLLVDPEGQEFLLGREAVASMRAVADARQVVAPLLEDALAGDLLAETRQQIEEDPQARLAERSRQAKARKDIAPLLGGEAATERQEIQTFIEQEAAREQRAIEAGEMHPSAARYTRFARRVGIAAEGVAPRGIGGVAALGVGMALAPGIGAGIGLAAQAGAQSRMVRQHEARFGFGAASAGGAEDASTEAGRLAENLKQVNDEVQKTIHVGHGISIPVRE